MVGEDGDLFLGGTCGGSMSVPRALSDAWGFEILEGQRDYFLGRWYDEGWHSQVMAGVPVRGLMNWGLGSPGETALGMRFLDPRKSDHLFQNPDLMGALEGWGVRSLVRFWFSVEGNMTGVEVSLDDLALLNLMESLKGRPGGFFQSPHETRLSETWTVSVVLSRFPWPWKGDRPSERVKVTGLGQDKWPHFYDLDLHDQREFAFTDEPILGVMTYWGQTLSQAHEGLFRLCRQVEAEGLQYRTDVGPAVGSVWAKVRRHLGC